MSAVVQRRAWPADLRAPGPDLVLELEVDGRVRAGRVVGGGLQVLDDDPDLPALAALAAEPGAVVVGHRAGRRAVVRRADGAFAKVARRSATRRALARLAAVDALLADAPAAAPARPEVLEADPGAGVVVLAAADGTPLDALLARGRAGECRRAGLLLGRALAVLAAAGPAPTAGDGGWPTHTLEDEAATTRRWTAAATAAGVLPPGEAAALAARQERALAALAALPAAERVPAHRDLHEGQVLVRGDGVLLLDWDTAALADPAADVANLLAHLDRLAAVSPSRPATGRRRVAAAAAGLRAGLREGGHPTTTDPAGAARTDVLREVAAVRLVAVHAFRRRPGAPPSGPRTPVTSPVRAAEDAP
ncbi:phosphotransferase [Pseudokineococcus sp. 5B2Z-1]|uniref:phosphotransferase n=1 Tax=Pseudokineococcus sp. 5B2Z-1 TaxID=3132744 RepID=UPI00309E3C17